MGGDDALKSVLEVHDIACTGWVTRDQVYRALAGADIYLHTAAWDGFPVTVLEAVRLGAVPVVRRSRAFEGIDLPVYVNSPSDCIDGLAALQASGQRVKALRAAEEGLSGFSREHQRTRLLGLYEQVSRRERVEWESRAN